MPIEIVAVAEDELSLAALTRLLQASKQDFQIVVPVVERGFGNIKRSIIKYRNASHVYPHVVLTDLDNHECPMSLIAEWRVARLPAQMMFRVAVRETEAWLLADQAAFAAFVGVPNTKVPMAPEELRDPEQALINIVRHSRNRRLAAELVPPAGSPVTIGPLYNERLVQFVRDAWNPAVARTCAPSLDRMLRRLDEFLR